MPRKPDPNHVPQKRGPKRRLDDKETKGFVLEAKHRAIIAKYRADHPSIESDSTVVRLALEVLAEISQKIITEL